MGSEACADELMNEENPVKDPSSNSKVADENCDKIVEVKDITLLSQSSDDLKEDMQIGPVTPDSNRENGEQNQDLSSPLTVVLPSPLPSPLSNSLDGYSLETPKGALYNSFSPGPDKLMQAPKPRKQVEDSRLVVKRLNFSCSINLINKFSSETGIETMSDEDHMFEIIHSTILDGFYLEQDRSHDSDSERPQTPKSATSYDSDSERPQTPDSARILSWVSDTCPGAPMKSKRKIMKIDQELCRKLEF